MFFADVKSGLEDTVIVVVLLYDGCSVYIFLCPRVAHGCAGVLFSIQISYDVRCRRTAQNHRHTGINVKRVIVPQRITPARTHHRQHHDFPMSIFSVVIYAIGVSEYRTFAYA